MDEQRIRLQTFAFDKSHELRPPSDRIFYSVIFGGIFSIFSITYPYRDVSVPTLVLATIGVVGLSALMAASWLRPQYYWASIAFSMYIPFSGEYAGDFNRLLMGMNLTNLMMVPIVFQWLMQRSQLNEPLLRFHAPDLPVLIFVILSSMSVLRVGIDTGTGSFVEQFIRLKRWLSPFLVYFLFVNMARNERGVRFIVVAICTALTAIAMLTMKESYDIGPGGTWDRIRVKGVLGQANATGAFFVYYTLIFLGFFLCNWRDKRFWLLLIPFLMCGRAMTLANSRGGLMAFTIAILATFWFRSKRLFLLGMVGLALAIAFPQYLPETISGRLIYGTFRPASRDEWTPISVREEQKATTFVEGARVEKEQNSNKLQDVTKQMDSSSQGRMAIWQAGYQLFLESPWFGHGYGTFPKLVGKYNSELWNRDPHNSYLGIAAEMGVFALVAFVLSVLLILKSCLHVYRYARDEFMRSLGLASVGMCMGLISANFFGSRLDTVELTAYFWIISALVVQYDTELRAQLLAIARRGPRLVVDPWAVGEEEEEEEEELGENF
ncbi:MAG TPA: O-antigen ligase family protein [Candidatus Sumerlaeota bacterium]|nr:O-antigen ligase family protein [Candidatus Sumerlaeota bacterium]HPS00123.1 O-antigen ligase family protein [Candidatus Sumerlaeota bacterium]